VESHSNSCPSCTCPEYTLNVQQELDSGVRKRCAALD
jgi:hypothetical protein